MKRKIEAMHERFGRVEGKKCGDCQNLVTNRQSRAWYKCAFYGCTSGESTDWRKKWGACGRFYENADESDEKPLIEILKHAPKGKMSAVCEGQLSLLGEQEREG